MEHSPRPDTAGTTPTRVSPGEHLRGMLPGGGGDLESAQHARDLLHPRIRIEDGDIGRDEAAVRLLGHAQLLRTACRHLGQMGDDQHLTGLTQLSQPAPHGYAAATADADYANDEKQRWPADPARQ